jgi:dolichyl-diphosphooligosaccharide--protein glycosyltransferase
MYNYFVSGESQGYGYARSNHAQFLASSDPDGWYDRFQNRVGYVVITDRGRAPANTTYTALHDGLGLGVNDTAATGHYQLLARDGGVRTFAVVPGARITIPNTAGDQVTATTTITVDTGAGNTTYEYARSAAVANGTATIRVAYPGEYQVGNHTVTVVTDDVFGGNRTTVPPA